MSVYFAQVGPYVKIGYARDPFDRQATITRNGTRPDDVAKGADVHLIGWVPGDRHHEASFHRRFAAHWAAGEWFRITPDDVRPLIWDDPQGVDVDRMSGLAVIAMWKWPAATRDEVAAAGIPIIAALETFGGAA